ncbi:MAG TPA: nitroreductase family deazaflavin-dependent oxidoreductase [Solirubrobacteraceae bacterium]|nr:nitroreductase family deazaflavin-dependent oxidoreductase [Solirubrobacteraceae bacterium]
MASHAVPNALVGAVLRSPAHRLLSGNLMLLTVRGRRTGREYTFPVQYARDGDTVYVVPGGYRTKTWWRNLLEPAPVQVRIGADEYAGTGQAFVGERDPERTADAFRAYLAHHPDSAKRRGLTTDDDARLREAAAREAIVRIDLAR